MEKLNAAYHPDHEYRELFDITADPIHCISTCIGIMKDGTLLYIEEKLMNSSSAYWIDREFFLIDKEEFRQFLETAAENGKIEKALKAGKTTEEELHCLSR